MSDELADMDKQFDNMYKNIKDHSRSALLGMLLLSVFVSVMGTPAAPQWNGEDEKNERGMAYEDEEQN